MVIYNGGTVVAKGSYWNPMDGRQVNMREEGILPGDEKKRYMRMSPLNLFIMAPLFGMMFVLFLPLFGIGMLLILCLVPIVSTLAAFTMTAVRICCRITGAGMVFHWKPSRAYFTRQSKKTAKNTNISDSKKKEE